MLTKKTEAFVMHFGEMGSRWGFNRTVGQILALLVIYPSALNADQIGEALRISRGNVSMGLKELQSWRLIQLIHHPGDRKDYFSAAGSFWDMAKTVFEERKKREVAPTLSLLRDNLLESTDSEKDQYAQKQMEELHSLLELLTNWSEQLSDLSPDQLQRLMRLGAGVNRIVELKDKVLSRSDH